MFHLRLIIFIYVPAKPMIDCSNKMYVYNQFLSLDYVYTARLLPYFKGNKHCLLRRQCWDTNRNIKRLMYCRYRKRVHFLWQRAFARNVRLPILYPQYSNFLYFDLYILLVYIWFSKCTLMRSVILLFFISSNFTRLRIRIHPIIYHEVAFGSTATFYVFICLYF